MTNIILPELGEGVTKATIACWHIKVGQAVKAGDEILEVVTDKAVFNVEAPCDGVLAAIAIPQGQDALVGGILGSIA